MSIEEKKAIVRHLFDEGFNKGNMEVASEIIAPDSIDYSPIPALMAESEGFTKRMAALRAAFVQEAIFGV